MVKYEYIPISMLILECKTTHNYKTIGTINMTSQQWGLYMS